MKSVLFIIDTLEVGGAEKSLLEIAANFHKYKPVFLQLFKGGRIKHSFDERNIEVVQLDLDPSYSFSQIAAKALPLVRRIQPSIIHTTLFRSDLVGRALKRSYAVPLVNSFVNNSYSSTRYQGMALTGKMKLFGIQMWDRFSSGRVDLFVSNSETIKVSNANALGIRPQNIRVIYRGRNIKDFEGMTSVERKQLRASLGDDDKVIFLNVSRLLERKGQLDLIRAFKKVVLKNSHCLLWIAGEGTFRKQIEAAIEEEELTGKVILLGSRNDVPHLLQAADFFVFPSYYEGLPGALIEAMMAGLPVIASAIPENLECVDASSASLFQPGNIDKMADAMLHAASGSAKDPGAVKRAKAAALKKFDINRIAAQYEEVYDELVARK